MKQRRIERNITLPEHVVRIVVHRPSIERGIPFTPRGRVQPWEYPYTDMEIGDSFHVLETETPNPTVSSRVHAYNVKHPDIKFACRTQINEKGEKLTRVWRIR
jgi:hypothetical protein